jgi:hypothetical protein
MEEEREQVELEERGPGGDVEAHRIEEEEKQRVEDEEKSPDFSAHMVQEEERHVEVE